MKKTLFVIIMIALACSLAFASGQQAKQSAKTGAQVSPPGEYPIVKDRVTLTAFVPSIGFIKDWKTNAAATWLEQKSNVHVEWAETSKVDARNKLSIMLASGDYPDMLVGLGGSGLSNQDLFRYGKQGNFVALNELVEKHGHYIKELFAAEPFVKPAITSPDGKIYSLPLVATDDYHLTLQQKFWINKAWLDRLGLKMPATLDEFYAVMKAFKERDANGNGNPSDEIPMTGAKRSMEDLAMWIMNAFIPAGGTDTSGDATLNNYEFIIDGKVAFTADRPEFREGLRFIKKLYSEGLMDVAALTQDREQIKPLVDGGNANRVGGATSHHPGNFASLAGDEKGRYREFVVLPPVKGPKGQQNSPWLIDTVIQSGKFVITDKCREPAVALRWADLQFSLDFGLVEKGVKGDHWDVVDPKENLLGINGKPAKYKYLNVLSGDDNAQMNIGPGWSRDLKNEFAKSTGYSYEEMLYNATKPLDPYKVRRFPFNTISIKEQDGAEFTDLRRTIHTYVGESVDRFIIGDLDIEKGWDSYLRQLNQIGLPRYLKILEDAWAVSN